MSASVTLPVSLPQPTEPGTKGDPVNLLTNAFGINVVKDTTFYRYWVGVTGQTKPDRPDVDLARVAADLEQLYNRRHQCILLMNAVISTHPLFQKDVGILYDGQHLLITPYDIFRESRDANPSLNVVLKHNEVPEMCHNFNSVQLTFTRDGDGIIEISRQGILEYGQKRGELGNTREIAHLLELAANQYCLGNPRLFLCFKNGKVYLPNGTELSGEFQFSNYQKMPEGTMLFPGSAKCATFIEGPKGRKNGNMALVVDASKAPFHVSEPLLDKYRNIFGGDEELAKFAANAGSFSHVVKGLFVQTTHLGPRKLFKIIDIAPDKTANGTTFVYNGSPISVAVYFQHRHNIALRQTDLPLVRCKGFNRRDDVFLPAELCVVAPNQRVTIQQQTPRLMKDAVKMCVIPPKQRQIDTRKSMDAMHLTNPENPFINALGVRLVYDPLTVTGRQLDHPTMIYAVDVTHASEGKWRGTAGSYAQGGRVGVWAMYFVASKTDRSANTEKCYAFGRSFVQNCKRRGIQVEDPEFVGFLQLDERDAEEQVAALEDMFSKARSHKCEFLFTVTSDKLPTHEIIKFLERKYQVPNQDLKMSTCNRIAENVKSSQTMENVINKFNVKLGGHNYNLHTTHIHNPKEYLKQERMIIGIAQSAIEGRNRETKEQRTVFGFAANSSLNPQEFVGGFRYHKDTEKAAAVKAIIAHVIKQYETSHQGQHPSEVVIYWNGQAEGEMSKVLGEIIHGGLQQAFAQLPRAPRWTFIMVVKRQNNIRIFKTDINPEDRLPKQNIAAGVVVDSQLTDPVKKQFFLNSHTTLQGSAATPCYTVLHDELDLSMDALETMTFGLAHLHQICSMTTSLPTPLYVATEYAKRGVCLLQEKVKMSGDAPEDELTADLGYADTVMADRRINA